MLNQNPFITVKTMYKVFPFRHSSQAPAAAALHAAGAPVSRRLKSLVVILMAAIICSVQICAKSTGGKNSYNYTRAEEEMRKGNDADAMTYLEKEMEENPGNGYAHMLIAVIQANAGNYGEAMTAVNKAIARLPKKDKEARADVLGTRANLYLVARDTVQGVRDFKEALRLDPDHWDILKAMAQLLYEMKNYAEADELYNHMVALNPMDVMGNMGLGRNATASGRYDEAVRQFSAVISVHDDYFSAYSFRGEAYLKQEKYREAADDVIKAITIENDMKAYHHLLEFPKEQLPLLVTKLKGEAVRNPHEAQWQYLIALLYHTNRNYSEAIEVLRKAFDIDAHPTFLEMTADCQQELGQYSRALASLGQAMQMRPDDTDLIARKADILGESGDIDGAIRGWTEYIDKCPDFSYGYYRRGFFKDNAGLTDSALEDYEMSLMLDPELAYSYLGKGDMLMRKGEAEQALEAYRKVVELDTVPDSNSCAMYALLALGEREKAVDFMEKVLAGDPEDKGRYYDGACFYCRYGDQEKGLANLRTSFEKGYRRFHHVMSDDDLEELRQTDGFRELMEEYAPVREAGMAPVGETGEEGSEVARTGERIEVPFTPDGGCVSVKCTINELPLSFIFDTGASVVSLSQLEANFMLKNGYLKREDFVGAERFVDANGDISEGTVVNLRDVDFGGLKLTNVRASVVRNQKAPLLLGQSVLGRLGSIEIDNPGKKLIITH